MGFRTLEISHAAEIHIKEGQLEIATEDGTAYVPIEDLNQVMVCGANIRLSTMDLSILSQNKVALMTLDDRYLPTAIVLPFEGHARQSKLMHAQVNISSEKHLELWIQIIKQKISNQARALSIMGLEGSEKIAAYASGINEENVDYSESLAAKEYFSYYHEGFNRRTEDPINSRLNYGYAIVRSAIARKLVEAGFHPTFGIHHDSQLNAFNLADDLIEPYRAMVDLVAHDNAGSNIQFFMRVVPNRKASEKHYRRIEEYAPKTGTVRLLRLTEKQYNNIYMVSGEKDYQETVVGVNSHIML